MISYRRRSRVLKACRIGRPIKQQLKRGRHNTGSVFVRVCMYTERVKMRVVIILVIFPLLYYDRFDRRKQRRSILLAWRLLRYSMTSANISAQVKIFIDATLCKSNLVATVAQILLGTWVHFVSLLASS